MNYGNFVIMLILLPVHIEIALVLLIGDSINTFASKHHHGAVHEVVHHIFDDRLEGVLIDSIEVNFVISHNLDPPCSSYVENIAAKVERVVIVPLLLASELIKLKLEEQDDGARSADKSCLIDQVHLPEIFIINVLECKVWLLFLLGGLNISLFEVLITRDFKYRHSIGLPLSVKGVDLIVLLIVE